MRAGVDVPLPPHDEIDELGGGSGWVALARARDDIDAHLMTGRLNAAGVETSSVKEFGDGAWLHGGWDPRSPVTIMVKKLQFDDARLVMAEISFDAPAAEPWKRSDRPRWIVPMAWWMAALALGLILTTLSFVGAASSEIGDRCEIPIICARD